MAGEPAPLCLCPPWLHKHGAGPAGCHWVSGVAVPITPVRVGWELVFMGRWACSSSDSSVQGRRASAQMAGPLAESGSHLLSGLLSCAPGCPESKDSFLLVSGFIVA